MNTLILNILGAFSSDYALDSMAENCDTYELVATMGTISKPEVSTLNNYLSQISVRDDIFMSFPDESVIYKKSEGTDLDAFLGSVENNVCRKNNVKFRFTLTKTLVSLKIF